MLAISASGYQKYLSTLSEHDKSFLTPYQSFIVRYFTSEQFKNKVLLLLYMEVGTGKTLTSLACGIEGIRTNLFSKIIILSPKSVQDEFKQNLLLYYKLGKDLDFNQIRDKMVMIPYNANNSSLQLRMLGDLEDSLFIIDEAHLFMKSIIKVSLLPIENRKNNIGNAKMIYDHISSLQHKKVICLTGTPSAKHPFETVPIFNLAGCNFPSNFEEFNKEFINYTKNTIKNKQTIISKIRNIVAYVKTDSSLQGLKASPLKIINVEMSEPQYIQYLIDYGKELQEKGFTNKRNVYGLPFGAISSFHAKTFEDCVYWNDKLTNRDDDKNRYVGTITIDDLHSPKIMRMYHDTEKLRGTCVFYFKFVRMYGAEAMCSKLQQEGYSLPKSDENIFESKTKRYVLFTGSIPYQTRVNWKAAFNDPRNMYGEYIKYLILSPSGAVGVTFRNVRYLGIGSVEYNFSMIRQIMGRANRLNSHIDLPLKDRKLDNYLYIMTKNKAHYKRNKEEINRLCSREAPGYREVAPTIERIIYQDSIHDDKINEQFRKCLQEASVL